MEFITELMAEIIFEVYGELMLLIIPQKGKSKRYVIISKIIAISVLLGVIALVIWGCILLFDYGNHLGIIPISIAAIVSLIQIIAGIILFKRNH